MLVETFTPSDSNTKGFMHFVMR